MFGRNPIEDLDLVVPSPAYKEKMERAPEYLQNLITRLHQAHHFARENLAAAVERQRKNYHHKPKQFEVGEQVWLFTPVLPDRKMPKFRSGWSGPWRVTRRINEVTYEIQFSHEGENRKEVVSIDRLRHCLIDHTIYAPGKHQDLACWGNEHVCFTPPEQWPEEYQNQDSPWNNPWFQDLLGRPPGDEDNIRNYKQPPAVPKRKKRDEEEDDGNDREYQFQPRRQTQGNLPLARDVNERPNWGGNEPPVVPERPGEQNEGERIPVRSHPPIVVPSIRDMFPQATRRLDKAVLKPPSKALEDAVARYRGEESEASKQARESRKEERDRKKAEKEADVPLNPDV